MLMNHGGEQGIRTLEALFTPTRFPIVLLRPLGQLSTMAPQAGFEPATNRLTADCSTTELLRNHNDGQFSQQDVLPLPLPADSKKLDASRQLAVHPMMQMLVTELLRNDITLDIYYYNDSR